MSRIVAGEESEGSTDDDVEVHAASTLQKHLMTSVGASGGIAFGEGEESEDDDDAQERGGAGEDAAAPAPSSDDEDELDFEFLGYKCDDSRRGKQRMADGIMSAIKPALHHLAFRLVELQEAQQMVCQTISRERTNLCTMPEFQHAAALISRLPQYQAKVQRSKRVMEATSALISKVEKQVAALKEKSSAALAQHTPKQDSREFAAARAAPGK